MVNIPEVIDTIPYSFWKSLAFQQINKRTDLKVPKWSILVNDSGIQVNKIKNFALFKARKFNIQGENFS